MQPSSAAEHVDENRNRMRPSSLHLIPAADHLRVVVLTTVVITVTVALLYARALQHAAKRDVEQEVREVLAPTQVASPASATGSPSKRTPFRSLRKSAARVSGVHGFFTPSKSSLVQGRKTPDGTLSPTANSSSLSQSTMSMAATELSGSTLGPDGGALDGPAPLSASGAVASMRRSSLSAAARVGSARSALALRRKGVGG